MDVEPAPSEPRENIEADFCNGNENVELGITDKSAVCRKKFVRKAYKQLYRRTNKVTLHQKYENNLNLARYQIQILRKKLRR